MHPFVLLRRGSVFAELRLIFIWSRQQREQLLKRLEIVLVNGGADHRLYTMVPRDVSRVCCFHRRRDFSRIPLLLDEARTPAREPLVKRRRVAERAAERVTIRSI